MSTVAIIGAGMMGSAMCWPLSDRGHHIFLVGTPLDDYIVDSIQEKNFHPTLKREIPVEVHTRYAHDIPQVVQDADWIISGVSSFGIPWFAETVGPYLSANKPVLSVTKGLEVLENGSLITLPEAIQRKVSAQKQAVKIAAIGGPCIAHELAARRQTGVVFTGEDAESLAHLKDALKTDYYHIWTSTDVAGVEGCAALKNAYAVGVGLAVGMMEVSGPSGLANMYNPQALLFSQSIYEMSLILQILKGAQDNLTWLPGPGDLYVTIFGGRTIALGKLLGEGVPYTEARQILSGVTLESVEIILRLGRSLPLLEKRGITRSADFPLLLHLNEIITKNAPVDIPWQKFFGRRR